MTLRNPDPWLTFLIPDQGAGVPASPVPADALGAWLYQELPEPLYAHDESPLVVTDAPQQPGRWITLDGANDYVDIGDQSAFDFADGVPFSVCAWVKTTTTVADAIMAKQLSTGNLTGWALRVTSTTGKLEQQVAATLGWYHESGAWRVGIDCDTATRDYPWRWAVGSPDQLVTEYDEATGQMYSYLPPGAQTVVWGAVRMTDLIEGRNPQKCTDAAAQITRTTGNAKVEFLIADLSVQAQVWQVAEEFKRKYDRLDVLSTMPAAILPGEKSRRMASR